MDETLDRLLERGDAASAAIAAPGRPALDRAGLRRLVSETGDSLRGLGVERDDVVALVLPNGPEAATAFLGVAAHCASAPLNPAYTESELAFYLDDLDAALLLVPAGEGEAARRVAAARGIAVADVVVAAGSAAGRFELGAADRPAARTKSPALAPARPPGLALVLHTSGTTSRPKMVALTQRNLCASAANVARSLALAPADRCLNVMPLFHIHGLIAAVLASLHSGGSVFCAPGFNALRFFAWLEESGATWYTAVPTIHQAVLDRAPRNADLLERIHLRLVRSSSAALAPQVMARLEEVFRAPVIEAYGMTEAAHQMASNPLPPRARKPGSVGVAAGPEVAIMDGAGRLLPAGETGEVVIRGSNVTGRLPRQPAGERVRLHRGMAAHRRSGMDGRGRLPALDRTAQGDHQSRRREDLAARGRRGAARPSCGGAGGHLRAAGREARRRGGGGGRAARRSGGDGERDPRLRAERLAAFKVPRRVVIVAEIPKGATGKMQRIGLAEKLGLVAPRVVSTTRSATDDSGAADGAAPRVVPTTRSAADDSGAADGAGSAPRTNPAR